MQRGFIANAQALMDRGRHPEAIALIERAAAGGDADALFQQGLWRLAGVPIERDLPAARQSFAAAATRGHAEARLITIALRANGTGAPADWPGATKELHAAAESGDAHAQYLLTMLSGMALNDQGLPLAIPAAEPLVPDASIRRIRALLTTSECAHVANSAADLLAPAVVVDPRTGLTIPHPIRTSDAAVLSPMREDLVIRAINIRIAAASGTQIGQGEALTVLRYRPGQQFRLHSDALPNVRNQRVKTVLVYLNDDFCGGQTTFPDHDVVIVPQAGDAIIFDNTDTAGRPLSRARHAGEPVTRGTKWLATRWIRARPFDVWTGPEAV